MASHATRDDIHLLDRFFCLDPLERFRWMRDRAPAYFEPDVDELAGAGLPLRPSNFIVGIEEMPVRFTPGG